MRKPPKNRAWRKFHVAVDAKTGDVVACDLTCNKAQDPTRVPALLKQIDNPIATVSADSIYDTKTVYKTIANHTKGRSPRVLIPPKKNAILNSKTKYLSERNRNIRSRDKQGKRKWCAQSGYNKRSLVETTFSRYKKIIGPMLRARTLQGQRVEARLGCKILNMMTALGMPKSQMID